MTTLKLYDIIELENWTPSDPDAAAVLETVKENEMFGELNDLIIDTFGLEIERQNLEEWLWDNECDIYEMLGIDYED